LAETRVKSFVLRFLLAQPLTYWKLLKYIDVDIPTVQKTLKNLLRNKILEYKNNLFYLTSKGREEAKDLGISVFNSAMCPECHGKTVTLSPFKWLVKEFESLTFERPKAISEYDQGYVDSTDTVARVIFMYQLGDIEGKNIILLGDDDLTSLALLASGFPKQVTVLEIDQRILNFIEKKAALKGWNNLEVIRYDVREPLPDQFKGKYDVFLTDPVETIGGLRLFLSRCVEALKGEGSIGYFGLTHLEASRQKWWNIQKDILEMGFTITDIVRGFHTYLLERDDILNLELKVVKEAPVEIKIPEVDFYTSNLFRIYAVNSPQPLVRGKVDWQRELYYDQEAYVTCP